MGRGDRSSHGAKRSLENVETYGSELVELGADSDGQHDVLTLGLEDFLSRDVLHFYYVLTIFEGGQ